MTDTVAIKKENILDLLVCAEDYGFYKPIILGSLVEWHGPITTKEIDTFAQSFLNTDQGYTEEDVESYIEKITTIFKRWGEIYD